MTLTTEKPYKAELVSVIIIFLNGEQFIQEAIDSIFAQTYKNWELLLVDDGSTDGSTAIAQQYANQYPDKVRYLEHEDHQNRGMSATRNLGIAYAQGEFIAFLDADDVWLPQKLEQQLAILEAQPEAGMIYGRSEIWYSWTGNPQDGDRDRDHTLSLGVQPNALVQPPTLFLLLLENKVQTPTTCSVLIRRQVFETVGGFQDAFRGMFEDQAFFTKVCLKFPVFVADNCWARYRQHPDSCCAIAEQKRTEISRLPLLNWITEYLTEQGVQDHEVWRALNREFWPYRHPVLHRNFSKLQQLSWRVQGKLKWTLKQLKAQPMLAASRRASS